MTEGRTTAALSIAALVMALAVWATAPRERVPELFADRGQPFSPDFGDPHDARSLEVIEFDAAGGGPRALKIVNRDGRWTIPSQFGYPADAKARIGDIAAALTTIRKDDVVSDAAGDHDRLGVRDPADASASGHSGYGMRIVLRGPNGRPLADLIVGGQAEGRERFRYVRLPRQNRVYLTRLEGFAVSAAFEDWIDRDVLQVKPGDIDEIVVRNYSVDERSGGLQARETIRLRQQGDRWTLQDGARGVAASRPRVNELLAQLVALRIVGVLPKPAGLAAMLNRTAAQQRISEDDVRDLARKGFYVTSEGEVLANEGEVIVHTRSGIFYTLRFGQVAPGVEAAVAAEAGDPAAGEHRYLFVTAAFDPSTAAPASAAPREAEQRVGLLHARFAPWYYIISASDFSKLRPGRAELVNQ
jgi:hypothetical protein